MLGGTNKEMMEAEMGYHLGYEKSARSDSDNERKGYKTKRVTATFLWKCRKTEMRHLSRRLFQNAKRIFQVWIEI